VTLTDPREALADQSDFIGYLVGLVGMADVVHSLASDRRRSAVCQSDADDFVHALVGLASIGAAIERIANRTPASQNSTEDALRRPPETLRSGWLR
jgi:hypothetical protein